MDRNRPSPQVVLMHVRRSPSGLNRTKHVRPARGRAAAQTATCGAGPETARLAVGSHTAALLVLAELTGKKGTCPQLTRDSASHRSGTSLPGPVSPTRALPRSREHGLLPPAERREIKAQSSSLSHNR